MTEAPHEWWHVGNCQGAYPGDPDGQDPTNDPPCGDCTEADQGATDLNNTALAACEFIISPCQLEEMCKFWSESYSKVGGLLKNCAYSGCPNVPNMSELGVVLPPCCF